MNIVNIKPTKGNILPEKRYRDLKGVSEYTYLRLATEILAVNLISNYIMITRLLR